MLLLVGSKRRTGDYALRFFLIQGGEWRCRKVMRAVNRLLLEHFPTYLKALPSYSFQLVFLNYTLYSSNYPK